MLFSVSSTSQARWISKRRPLVDARHQRAVIGERKWDAARACGEPPFSNESARGRLEKACARLRGCGPIDYSVSLTAAASAAAARARKNRAPRGLRLCSHHPARELSSEAASSTGERHPSSTRTYPADQIWTTLNWTWRGEAGGRAGGGGERDWRKSRIGREAQPWVPAATMNGSPRLRQPQISHRTMSWIAVYIAGIVHRSTRGKICPPRWGPAAALAHPQRRTPCPICRTSVTSPRRRGRLSWLWWLGRRRKRQRMRPCSSKTSRFIGSL